MLKKVMANLYESFYIMKSVLFVLVLLLCSGFGLAGSWDSFEEGNGSSVVLVENSSEDSGELGVEETKSFNNLESEDFSLDREDSFEYTLYFYIALGVGVVGILIVVLFIYLFLRRPKNQWDKRRISK